MTIKLIATDMDGTFLDAKGKYDQHRFEMVLEELEKRGIHFVIATGNALPRMAVLFGDLYPRLTFVAENGAYLFEEMRPLVRKTISDDLVAAFLEYFKGKEQEYVVSVSGEHKTYLMEGAVFPRFHAIEEKQRRSFLERMVFLEDWTELPDDAIYKLNVIVPEAECDAITSAFNQVFAGRLRAVTSGYGTVDVLLDGIDKGWGLQQLMERYGVTPEQVMAFGDNDNDLEMLELARESYAMDNAPDRVKAVAKYIAPHHDEGGVLHIIEAYLQEN